MAKTASKTTKKPAPKTEISKPQPQRVPISGERVRRSGADTEYEITYVSLDGRYVHIGIPRTNFEHRNVAVSALIFLEELRTPPKPAKPVFNLEAIDERLASAQHASTQEMSSQLAVLKKYFRTKHVPEEVLMQLDSLCHDNEQRWQAAITRILQLMQL